MVGIPAAGIQPTGILAIWNDCAAGRETIYEQWYLTEHLPERISIPGFAVGRRYRAIDADRQFLTTYEVDTPAVLTSDPYRERLTNPTTLTREIMANGFIRASRTICERRDVVGSIRGAVALTVELRGSNARTTAELPPLEAAINHHIVHRESWVALKGMQSSTEEDIRGPDERISRCLLFEFSETEPALQVAETIRQDWLGTNVGVYGLMCTLDREAIT